MANCKSAKKRIRVIDKKTARNRRVKNHLKDVLKSFEANIAAGEMEAAKADLKLAEKKLMQAAAKGNMELAKEKLTLAEKKVMQAAAKGTSHK